MDISAGSPSPRLTVAEPESGRARRPRRAREERDLPVPYVTALLLTINIALFTAMWLRGRGDVSQVGYVFGLKDNSAISGGQFWRLITPIFLHGSLIHLGTNCLSLLMLGMPMERIYGARKFFLIYMTAGLASFVLSFLLNVNPSLGASGAIFGLVGAGIVFPLRFHALVPPSARNRIVSQLVTVAVINFAIGAVPNLPIDNWAHFGGFLGGAFMALFLLPDALDDGRPRPVSDLLVSAAVAAMLVVIGWAGLSQWRFAQGWFAQHPNWGSPIAASARLDTFGPAGNDPWWTIGIPRGWKPLPGGYWRSPLGALVRVVDSAHDPQTAQRGILLIREAGQEADTLTIDRKRAWHIGMRSPQTVGHLYVIETYGRYLLITLECPARQYLASSPDFANIIASIRIVHPPNDLPLPSQLPSETAPDG